MKYDIDKLQKFFLDPDWPYVQQAIEDHFEFITSIEGIDETKTPENIAAQVMTSKKIKEAVENLRAFIETAKSIQKSKKVTFK